MARNSTPSETSPLLRHLSGDDASPPISLKATTSLQKFQNHLQKWRTVVFCTLFIIAVDVPSLIGDVSKLRMLELGACREYYGVHDPSVIDSNGNIEESLCKDPAIQSRLAQIRSLMAFIEAVPGLVMAVPFGILADRKGRRLVLALCLFGYLARDTWMLVTLYFYNVFPLSAVYGASLSSLIGGGSTVLGPMLLAIVAASVTDDLRTQAFFMLHVLTMALEFVSPPIGGVLLDWLGPYMTLSFSIPMKSTGFIFLTFLAAIESSNVAQQQVIESVEVPQQPLSARHQIRKAWADLAHYVRYDMATIFAHRSIVVGLLAMLIAKIARPVQDLTAQYLSAKFKWPISKTNMLLSIGAAAQIPWFLLALPALSAYLQKRKGNPIAANRALAIILVSFLWLGMLSMGLAPTINTFIIGMVIHTAGSGYTAAMRSLLTSLISTDQLSILFTSITVFEAISLLAAAPLLQMSLSWGLQAGGLFVSMPFFIAAVLYGLASFGIIATPFKANANISPC